VYIVGIDEERGFGKDRRHVDADENYKGGSLFDSTILETSVALLQATIERPLHPLNSPATIKSGRNS
jgi:hypothetical protein